MSWPSVALSSICRPRQWPTISQKELKPSGYPVYGANGVIGFFDRYTHKSRTVLITCRGATCGNIHVCVPESYVTGNAMALDDLAEAVNCDYLAHALRVVGLQRAITGTAQPQITRTSLEAIKVPLPPLDEQRRIAAILDQAEELRAKRRAAIALLDQLPQAIFLEMFGDIDAETVILGDHTERVTKGTTPTTLGFAFTDSGVPLLRVQNLRENRIDFTEDVLYIACDTHLAFARSQILPGDVLTTIAGTIGRTVIVPSDAPEANCNQAIAIITPKASLNQQYLRYWLSSSFAQRQISQSQVTATISNLSLGQIKGLKIPLPSLELQQHFAHRIEALQRAKSAHQSALAELDALFGSLQHRAFSDFGAGLASVGARQ